MIKENHGFGMTTTNNESLGKLKRQEHDPSSVPSFTSTSFHFCLPTLLFAPRFFTLTDNKMRGDQNPQTVSLLLVTFLSEKTSSS